MGVEKIHKILNTYLTIFVFTYSALSAMEFIFGMLSDLRAVSAIIKRLSFWPESEGLKMKTYTITWRHAPLFGLTLSRCRFDNSSVLWHPDIENDVIMQFAHKLSAGFPPCRIVCCGKLIARSATYQGV